MFTASSGFYTLSLHDALPIFVGDLGKRVRLVHELRELARAEELLDDGRDRLVVDQLLRHQRLDVLQAHALRSEEHTSELQSHVNLVCRLLLEKKNKLYIVNCG